MLGYQYPERGALALAASIRHKPPPGDASKCDSGLSVICLPNENRNFLVQSLKMRAGCPNSYNNGKMTYRLEHCQI